jgi:hypothetical protein
MTNRDIHLIAYYHQKPKDPKRTKEPGYMTNVENIAYDESINITRGIKTKDQLQASVILNLNKETVVKNSFQSDADYVSLLAHYQEGYPKYINPLLAELYPEVKDDGNVPTEEKTQA